MKIPKYLQVDEPLRSARIRYTELKYRIWGYRWTRDDEKLSEATLNDLADKYVARLESDAELKRLALENQKAEPEERDGPDNAGYSTFGYGTGGGQRVIRGTRSLGG